MSEEKRGQEAAPGINPEERPDLEDYKSKDNATSKKLYCFTFRVNQIMQ
jgi:hypothetical protein